MRRIFWIFLLIFFISCSGENKTQMLSNCDINKAECALLDKSGKEQGRLSIYPKPLIAMAETTFKFSGFKEIKEPNIRIYGLSMDMGTIKTELEKTGAVYSTNVIISACTENVMKYRLEVLDGKEFVAFIDFDVKG